MDGVKPPRLATGTNSPGSCYLCGPERLAMTLEQLWVEHVYVLPELREAEASLGFPGQLEADPAS